jgi:hypothetical protein
MHSAIGDSAHVLSQEYHLRPMLSMSDPRQLHLSGWMTSVAGVLLLALPGGVLAATPTGVIELFTSQGCDSCPPAEALLGQLIHSPGVIALSYHVTYWDALGWHDRFGLHVADQRQQFYVSQLRLPSAFTPQAVINGRVSAIGSDQRSIVTALSQTGPTVAVALGVDRGRVRIALPAAATPPSTPLQVICIAYVPRALTEVGAGENAGRKLQEFDIVRTYLPVGNWQGAAAQFSVPLAQLPPEATGIAVLVQEPQGRIVGAATLAAH